MLTKADATTAIAEAINAGDAHHAQFDLDAIATGVYEATGGYDTEAMDHDAFWQLVADNDRSADTIHVRTYLLDADGNPTRRIDGDTITRGELPLVNRPDPVAVDLNPELGVEPGAAVLVKAVTLDGTVIDSYETTAD